MNEDDDQNDGTYQFKSLFYKADKNKDGLISYQELNDILSS
jgi:Ca2+-binding EF-hand superfamily protein